MAKEILAIPEERLAEVIMVIRAGLVHVQSDEYPSAISIETIANLEGWCDDEEKYLDRISGDEAQG